MLIPMIRALGTLGDRRTFDVLTTHLNMSNSTGRANVANALGKLGDPRAIPVLEQLTGDNGFAWEEDHGGPKYTVGDVARRAIETIRKSGEAPEVPPKKPKWKFW